MRKLLLTIFLAFATLSFAADYNFSASAPQTVIVGNEFLLTYSINASAENLRAPSFENFDIMAGPSPSKQMSSTFVNGKFSQEVLMKYTYVLMPKKEGIFEISPATLEVKGRKISSNSLTIKVVKNDQAGSEKESEDSNAYGFSGRDIFIRSAVSKTKVFQQEALLYTLKLYTRVNVRDLENLQYPDFKGFLVFDIDLSSQNNAVMENINGLTYRSQVIKQSLLIPQSSGKLTIDGVQLDAIVQVRNRTNPMDVFEDFFGTYTNVRKRLNSEASAVNVEPFPAGAPSGFAGISGDFTLTSKLSSTNVKANEPITLEYTIQGTGNFRLIGNPKINFPADFEAYDPEVDNKYEATTSGLKGYKKMSYVIIPRYSGTFTIPALTIPFFDSKTGTYKILNAPAYTVEVKRNGDEQSNGVVSTLVNKEDLRFLGKDIRHIALNTKLMHKSNNILKLPAVYLFYIVPIIIYLLLLILYRQRVKLYSNQVLLNNRKAGKTARKKLKIAADAMKKGDSSVFYSEILKALYDYTAHKLMLPVSSLNRENIELHVMRRGGNEESLAELKSLLDLCEFAQYAPSAVDAPLSEVYNRAARLITNLDKQLK